VRRVAARSGRFAVLAGPGVIDAGAIDGLRAFATAGGLGVANTWGAKGVFAWDSPHHLGTCGLQAHDFELLGFADADLIIATGVDGDESPTERFALAPVEVIAPTDLALVAGEYVAVRELLHNNLYARLAAVAQPGYVDEKVPVHPARAVADLGAVLPPGGLVTADPGPAGLWVARTFPTPPLDPGAPRRVIVPARRAPGIATTLASDAARAGRVAIAVTTSPLDSATEAALEDARRQQTPFVLVVWSARGDLERAADHRQVLAAALAEPGPTVVEVPVALEDTRLLVQAAGEVVAWGGLTPSP
jgi:thiamine pyrophosphate-dependent acetolactate synthase large subunit-like protein